MLSKASEATQIKIGDKVKINLSIVKDHDSTSPYIRLVNSIIRNSDYRTPEVVDINLNSTKPIEIASWKGAKFLKSASIPAESCTIVC